MSQIRLQKYIADCGITSRRKAEGLIIGGRVQINGETITLLGTKVSGNDCVMVDGQAIDRDHIQKTYIVFNKPRSVMTTLSDPEGRPTVMDYLKEFSERIYPVGRLDYLSEGLLIMTNDGELANIVAHPSHEIVKVYEVKVFGSVTASLIKKLRDGVTVEGQTLIPKSVRIIEQLPTKTWLEFRLSEGKNREIRKICEACGLTVDKLRRVAIGGLTVDSIRAGGYREIGRKKLLELLGVRSDGTPNGKNIEYWSDRKTVNIKKKGHQNFNAADDEMFHKFRRENYFQSIKDINTSKAIAAQKEQERLLIEKKEHQDKKVQKRIERDKRRAKKRNLDRPVHAAVID